MSQKLFTCVLKDIFRKIKWGNIWGLRINVKRLSNLRFVDDFILVISSARVLHQMLMDLNDHSKTSGFTMNFRETKTMSNRTTKPFIIDKTEIQLVDEYICLNLLVTLNGKMSKGIKRRVSQAWKAFWALKIYPPGQVSKQET